MIMKACYYSASTQGGIGMDEAVSCGLLLKQLHDGMEKRANNDLRAHDLTMAQVSVLMLLYGAEDGTLPLKGQILNAAATYWFDATKHLVPNHVLEVPDPNVIVGVTSYSNVSTDPKYQGSSIPDGNFTNLLTVICNRDVTPPANCF